MKGSLTSRYLNLICKSNAEKKYEKALICNLKAPICHLEEEMPNKEVGPVCCVVGDGEPWVLAEASQLFPVFETYQMSGKIGVGQLASVGT